MAEKSTRPEYDNVLGYCDGSQQTSVTPVEYQQPFGNAVAQESMQKKWWGGTDKVTPKQPLPGDTKQPERPQRDAAKRPNTKPPSGVEVCTREADIIGNSLVGAEHWWIRTPNIEGGMGCEGAGVPGRDGLPDLPLCQTTVNDHTGQGSDPGSTCVPAHEFNPRWAKVDQECVERESRLGTPTGRWAPPFNDCHTWVKATLDNCRPKEVIEAEQKGDADRAERRLEILDRMY